MSISGPSPAFVPESGAVAGALFVCVLVSGVATPSVFARAGVASARCACAGTSTAWVARLALSAATTVRSLIGFIGFLLFGIVHDRSLLPWRISPFGCGAFRQPPQHRICLRDA